MGNPFQVLIKMSGEFPTIKSAHSLVAKHVTKEKWDKLKDIETKTCGFTLAKACACAIEFDNQHCGIYAGCWDSYKDFAIVFDPLIQEYRGISADAKHTSDMDPSKVNGNISPEVPVHSTRIRVGRNIDGFGLSPGSWLMTTSSSCLVMLTLRLPVWSVTGPRAEVSSIMRPRPSCSGSMRRIRQESSPCNRAVTSRVSSSVLPVVSRLSVTLSRPSMARTLLWMSVTVTSTPAPPI